MKRQLKFYNKTYIQVKNYFKNLTFKKRISFYKLKLVKSFYQSRRFGRWRMSSLLLYNTYFFNKNLRKYLFLLKKDNFYYPKTQRAILSFCDYNLLLKVYLHNIYNLYYLFILLLLLNYNFFN